MAQPGVFRWKTSVSLEGQADLLAALLERVDDETKQKALEKMAHLVYLEAYRLAPREEGLLESEIQVFYDGDMPSGVGVPSESPAIERAWATEFGTWNWDVGTPNGPKTGWPAKSKPEAAMPWLRTGLLVARPRVLRMLRRLLLTGKRGVEDDT